MGADAAAGFDRVVNSVKTFLDNINFLQIGRQYAGLISDAIKGLLDTVISFLQTANWQNVGTTIWTGITSAIAYVWGLITGYDYLGIISRVFELLGSALGAAAALIEGLGKAIWEGLKQAWTKTLEYFEGFKDEAGGDIWQGLLDGIVNAAVGIYEFFRDKIVKPFIEGFKRAFGIASPSTVMAEQGVDIIEGLKQGIENAWNAAVGWFDERIIAPLKSWFSEAWNSIKDFAFNAWIDIENVWSTASNWFSDNVIEPIKNAFDAAFQKIKEFVESPFVNLGEFVRGIFNGVIGFLNGLLSGLTSGINSVINAMNNISFSIPDWVPLFGGRSFGVNIPNVSGLQIQPLATGAVIPPNAPFMAVVGDQRSGTNIEAPEALIRQIVREETGGMGNQNITITFGGTMGELVRQLKPHIERENSRVGNTMLAQAVRVS
jgi:phage-related protein